MNLKKFFKPAKMLVAALAFSSLLGSGLSKASTQYEPRKYNFKEVKELRLNTRNDYVAYKRGSEVEGILSMDNPSFMTPRGPSNLEESFLYARSKKNPSRNIWVEVGCDQTVKDLGKDRMIETKVYIDQQLVDDIQERVDEVTLLHTHHQILMPSRNDLRHMLLNSTDTSKSLQKRMGYKEAIKFRKKGVMYYRLTDEGKRIFRNGITERQIGILTDDLKNREARYGMGNLPNMSQEEILDKCDQLSNKYVQITYVPQYFLKQMESERGYA